ncbi:MAG TPA: gamma-glutamyltransferase [Capillimicrobium sp.]
MSATHDHDGGATRRRRATIGAAAGAVALGIAGAAVGYAQGGDPPHRPAAPFGAPTAADTDPGEGIAAVAGDRASNWAPQTRSEVLARNGIVATSHPLAAQAGRRMRHAGGNAADAAVAAAATAAVVEPLSTNLGADMFALYWSAQERKLYALNASGWSPKAWTPEYFAEKGRDAASGVPLRGVDSVTVPGAIDGWHRLLERFGTMGFKRVLAPASRLAADGYGLTERERSDWLPWVDDLRADKESARTWLVDGEAPPLYGVFRNPDMARALDVLRREGRDAFYEGRIARAIVRRIRRGGGAMTLGDLSAFRSQWVKPISTSYHGYDVHQTPPNSQGFAVLEMLNILEACAPEVGIDLRQEGPRSPRFWHLLVEAKKLAFADLHAYNADPRRTAVPVDRLTSKAYAATLCDRIDPDRAAVPPAAAPPEQEGGTVYLTAADRWGNMVSFIYSIYYPFGSAVTVPDYGFLLQNRGNGFSLDPSHPNVVAPRKRPFNTIIPGFVTKGGKPVLSFGNMGGPVQAQAQATELVNMIDLGMNVQAAGDAARFSHDQTANELQLEPQLFGLVGEQLQAMGHDVRAGRGGDLVAGGYQAIHVTPGPRGGREGRRGRGPAPFPGVYRAGSDHRKDGAAVGW